MRNGVSLSDLRNEVLIEAGFSTEAGHSAYSEERLNQMINRHERLMAVDYDWGAMTFEEDVVVAADARYVSLPEDISFTMIDSVAVAYGDDWLPVLHGIGSYQRSLYNETQRSTPIMRWEIVAPGDEKLEVWPIGNISQTLRFTGSKKIGEMKKDTDVCSLDADVLVMRVAAQILGRDQKEDAALMLQQADAHARAVTKRQGSMKSGEINLGRRRGVRLRPGIDYIPPGA